LRGRSLLLTRYFITSLSSSVFFFLFFFLFFFFHVSSLSIFFLLEIGIRAAPLSRDSRSDLAERGQLRGEMWRTT